MHETAKYISIDPAIRFGKPCIVGTRITIDDILSWLSSGMTENEILSDFPTFTAEHIRAAIAFEPQLRAINKAKRKKMLDLKGKVDVWDID